MLRDSIGLHTSAKFLHDDAVRAYARDLRIIRALALRGFEPLQDKAPESGKGWAWDCHPRLEHSAGRDLLPYIDIRPKTEAECEYYLTHLQEIFPGHVPWFCPEYVLGFRLDVLLEGERIQFHIAYPASDSCKFETVTHMKEVRTTSIHCGEHSFEVSSSI